MIFYNFWGLSEHSRNICLMQCLNLFLQYYCFSHCFHFDLKNYIVYSEHEIKFFFAEMKVVFSIYLVRGSFLMPWKVELEKTQFLPFISIQNAHADSSTTNVLGNVEHFMLVMIY